MVNYFRVLWFLHSLLKRAYWDNDRLVEYQQKRLRSIIKYAFDNVPFYHEKFHTLGITPDDIRNKKDLNRLPIVRKEEIKKSGERIVSREFDIKSLTMLSTSGSTGKPLFLYINEIESEFRKAKHLRANISCGQRPRDRWINITSPLHFGDATRLQRVLGLYAPIPVSVFDSLPAQISKIEKMKPDVLDGYSSSILLLAKEVKKRGISTIRPRFVLGGSELIDDYSRRYIEETLDAEFYDQYSSVEFDRIAWQCPKHQGYHIDADDLIVQFVDNNGEEVSDGERGEIVCTSLFNYAMPFIRYAVGDVGVASNELCTCGRTLPLMKVVEGRKDSLLRLPDGRILTPRVFTIAMHMFRSYRYIDQFRVVQKRPELFEINIKLKENSFEKNTMQTELLSHLEKILNVDRSNIEFVIKFVDNIPLDKSGKLMAVVSELSSHP